MFSLEENLRARKPNNFFEEMQNIYEFMESWDYTKVDKDKYLEFSLSIKSSNIKSADLLLKNANHQLSVYQLTNSFVYFEAAFKNVKIFSKSYFSSEVIFLLQKMISIAKDRERFKEAAEISQYLIEKGQKMGSEYNLMEYSSNFVSMPLIIPFDNQELSRAIELVDSLIKERRAQGETYAQQLLFLEGQLNTAEQNNYYFKTALNIRMSHIAILNYGRVQAETACFYLDCYDYSRDLKCLNEAVECLAIAKDTEEIDYYKDLIRLYDRVLGITFNQVNFYEITKKAWEGLSAIGDYEKTKPEDKVTISSILKRYGNNANNYNNSNSSQQIKPGS